MDISLSGCYVHLLLLGCFQVHFKGQTLQRNFDWHKIGWFQWKAYEVFFYNDIWITMNAKQPWDPVKLDSFVILFLKNTYLC